MKIFIIGGTGLIGSAAAGELIARGHEVYSIALPPLPEGAVLPEKMKIEFGNYLEMDDDELRSRMQGMDGFVFAAGVDERVEGKAPVYELYRKYNIDPVKRLLRIAKECGVKHTVILGSYFSYFAKIHPERKLTEYHHIILIYVRVSIRRMRLCLLPTGTLMLRCWSSRIFSVLSPAENPCGFFLRK